MTNNKYGSLVIEKDENNEFLDTYNDDALQIDRESQQLLVDDIANSTSSNSAITTNINSSNSSSNNSKGRTIFTTFVVVVLLVIFGVVAVVGSSYNLFGEGETMVISASASASTSSTDNSVVINEIEVVEDGNNNKLDNNNNNNNNNNDHEHSPFFNVTLPWKQVQMSDSHSLSSDSMNNHYKAVIEFCSDPTQDLYGYGLLGACIPGQTTVLIRMKPKQFYHLTLVNNGHIDTNLHTHGLHVSGVGTVDDVTRLVEPGKCITYDYNILDDADVGTYWYHPHRHPLTTRSAYGGAYGMLIVDEIVNEYYPPQIENFLKHNEVLLQFSSMFNKKLPNATRSNKVNHQTLLDLTIQPEMYYYFRVSSVVYAESVNYVEFIPQNACDVRPIAYDGVYRSEIPHPGNSTNKHMMTVSSRVDLSVRCSEDAEIHFHQGAGPSDESKMVQIHLASSSSSSTSTVTTNDDPTDVTLSPNFPSSPYWDMDLETSWKPRRPYYMPNLADPKFKVDEKWHISMDDYFLNGTKGVSVNQVTWDPDVAIRTFDLGQLIEFPIMLSQSHPYHAHINRMQIVEPGGCGGRFEEGEYFDTIVQSSDKKECNVRQKFFDFAGRIVIHCHRFGHEDQGMMTWIDVLGGHGHGMSGAPQTNCSAVL